MREKPINLALSLLAICVLADLFIAKEPRFVLSMGVFGALVLRAASDEPLPSILAILGLALTGLALANNHQVIDVSSATWFVITLLIALLYANWEKIYKWF
jgi:hypothetical protein